MPPIEALIFAPLIVLAANIVFGISGFGLTLISIPLLAHLFPIKFVIPMVVLLDVVASLRQATRLRGGVYRTEFLALLPFMLAGMVAGAFLLVRLPAEVLLLALGALVLVYGAYYALRHDSVFRLARWTVAPIGVFAGAASAVLGVGAPLFILYLTGRGATPDHIRATMPVIFSFTTVGRIILFTVAGLFTREIVLTSAALVPMMLLGLYVGNRMHVGLSRETMVRIIGALLVLSGTSLILRALG
ncbi:MAG: sulfite exporter TauE/SafE family protein [Burkholderiales bacterium]|nr:sulfite exporter TauE/SafE family protein [Burkholderiales bacterium]